MSNAKFTVIIPTRERADVLFHCLKTVVDQDYDNLEIIVSDNHSADDTRDVVESFRDPRVRYVSTGRRLSMSGNWEFGLSNVSGGWVSILGDDDGFLPNVIKDVDALASLGMEAVLVNYSFYRWPIAGEEATAGFLHVPQASGYEIRKTSEWLPKVMRGSESYVKLPYLYTGGFVHSRVIDRIRQAQGGKFFRSSIPDVFSALRISSVIDQYVYCHTPKVVMGISKHSTGSSRKKDYQPLVNFNRENDIGFHPDVPLHNGVYPPSSNALVYESYLQAGAKELFEKYPTDTRQQLKYIISTPIDKRECARYAELYARTHGIAGIDLARVQLLGKLLKFGRLPGRVARKLLDRLSCKVAMQQESTVHDAAQVTHWVNANQGRTPRMLRPLIKNYNL